MADVDVHHEGVEHHQPRRRDHRADDRARGRDGGGELAGIAVLLHRRNQHRAERRGVRHGRPGKPGEQHGGCDVDVREPAADVAQHRAREVDERPRHHAGIHDLAGEDEERHRHDREGCDAGEHPVHLHAQEGQPVQLPELEGARPHHGEEHRHADEKQDQETPEDRQPLEREENPVNRPRPPAESVSSSRVSKLGQRRAGDARLEMCVSSASRPKPCSATRGDRHESRRSTCSRLTIEERRRSRAASTK